MKDLDQVIQLKKLSLEEINFNFLYEDEINIILLIKKHLNK